MTPRRKQPIVSTTDDEQTVATIDPEDELRDHWDNPLFGKKEDSSFESKRDTKYSARANVQKRLQLRPAIELEDSKYQGKVVDRKELDGVEDNWVSVEDSEDSQLSFEEEIENQDSVEDSVKESLDNSQFSLQLYSQTQQQASKGHAILEQKSIYNDILKLRIAIQRLLTMVNCFPDQHGRSLLKQMDPFGTENKFSNVTQSLFEIITKMKQIQDVLFCSSSNLSIALNGDTVSGKDSTRIASEDTQSNSNLDEEKLWRQLEKRNIQLHSFRLKVLDYWDRKVREATGKIYDQTNKFKVINQTVPNQIQGVLSNRERLLRRAHTRRDSNRSLLCLSPTEENGIEPNIYDDSDFFQLLLKEVVNDMSTNVGSIEDRNHASQLKRNRKRKQYLDRRESKGRRLKYTVHEKMVGFLAPIPFEQSKARDQLLKSLFGGVQRNK